MKRMSHSLFLVLLLLFALTSSIPAQDLAPGSPANPVLTLQDANAVLDEAHLLFERGETEQAMELYVRVAQSGFASPAVWANAGTAAYRAGDVGRSVLYYSRALHLDPTYDRALRSLEFVSPATNVYATGQRDALRGLLLRTPPMVWILLGQAIFLLLCFALAKSIAAVNRERRGHWLAVLGWSAVFAIIFVGVGGLNYYLRVSHADAVVVVDRAIARSEPRAEATGQLELPAGTIVEILEYRPDFLRVRLADGSGGFISRDQIEAI